MNIFDKESPFRIANEQRMQKLREKYRITSDKELQLHLKREMDLALERLFKKEESVGGEQTMDKLGDTLVTCKMLDLAKQEIKSEITTLRLEVRQQGNNLTNDMGNLRQEMTSDMGNLRQELTSDMKNLRQELTRDMNNLRIELTGAMNNLRLDLINKIDLMMQKMDENQARWRVDIEDQRHVWRLAHDH